MGCIYNVNTLVLVKNRCLTGGRGYFTMEFDHYDVVPNHIAGQIIEIHKKEMEAKKEE